MIVTPVISLSGPGSAATRRGANITSLVGSFELLFQLAPAIHSVSKMPYMIEGSHSGNATMLTRKGRFTSAECGSIGFIAAILPLLRTIGNT